MFYAVLFAFGTISQNKLQNHKNSLAFMLTECYKSKYLVKRFSKTI